MTLLKDTRKFNISLLVTAVILFLLGLWVNDPFRWKVVTYKESPLLIKNVSVNDISEVLIEKGKEKINLKKENAVWYVSSENTKYRADTNRISKNLSEILEIHRYQKVTSSKEKHKDYEVATPKEGEELKALRITAKDNKGKTLFTIYLGKQGATYNSTLVRLEGEDAVYSAKGALRNNWKIDVDFYRDKQLLNLVAANVKEITVTGKKTLKLRRNDKQKWEVFSAGWKEANQDKVNNLLKDFLTLQGTKFIKEAVRDPFFVKVNIALVSGNTETVMVRGPGKENNYIVQTTYTPYWMSVPSYRIDNFLNKPEDLLPPKQSKPNKK
ncbi:MAG: DUF4340 domain-containing protein [Candidatus Hydrogenedentota bacterium]|nr:MAG: DUF4340 domain-containing protein [Candidatus Hydrogenedentota bacterium]